jgi:hypothetical protein
MDITSLPVAFVGSDIPEIVILGLGCLFVYVIVMMLLKLFRKK